jgi:hypothetical protein
LKQKAAEKENESANQSDLNWHGAQEGEEGSAEAPHGKAYKSTGKKAGEVHRPLLHKSDRSMRFLFSCSVIRLFVTDSCRRLH